MIIREDICPESDTLLKINNEMSDKYAKALAGLSKALKSYKKKDPPRQNMPLYSSSSSTASESELGKFNFSKSKRPRRRSMNTIDEET